ncbi:MAG TPA: peptidoglycan DD-metalloendopeptidase family protein [Anaerolineales bacterium]|nr:peptidoglycan DD-metalloendopeptidase family protein [Anaerolineales bacterium]
MYKRITISILLLSLIFASISQSVSAQANGPIYIVQPGDTLSFIASRFNVSLNELVAANPTIDPNLLSAGQQIIIPGLESVTGILETEVIPFGDTLRSLSRRRQVSDEQLIKLNRLVSPTELYVGISLIVPVGEGQDQLSSRISAGSGETLLELSVKQGSNPWSLSSINKLSGTWDALPGDILYSPTGNSDGASGLPSAFISASIEPLPMVQGGTEVVSVQVKEGYTASGTLVDHSLRFFPVDGQQVAMQGIHALQEPGVYPLRIDASLPDGSRQSYEQMVLVTTGNYRSESIYVEPETIDPATTEAENNQIYSITSPVTATRYWNGVFTSPAVYPDEFTSFYGTRRIYFGLNSDLTVDGFHSGLDFAGGEGLQIFAPAPGQVVFSGPLIVRGNATLIDHGWGVYTGYWHQSESYVQMGDFVEQGQVIGLVGGTGRVTGPHLHWEVWVNGVQVNPLDWLNQAYP